MGHKRKIPVLAISFTGTGTPAKSQANGRARPIAAKPAIESKHVFLLVEENESYLDVVGSPRMPYFNSLIKQGGLATNYYANTHPSIGNYFELLSGQIVTNDDGFSGVVTADNLIRKLVAAGKTWKSYAEGLPQTGYTGERGSDYLRRHNPASYLSDVVNNTAEARNLVPFSQFSVDLQKSSFPQFAFVVPNAINDGHNCKHRLPCFNRAPLRNTDAWLKKEIPPLLHSAAFRDGGLLIITWDEAEDEDKQHGGGQVPALLIGPHVKPGYRSDHFYQEQNILRTICEACGLTECPGDAAQAASMAEFFGP